MSSLPTWAAWSIVVPLVLLSPVLGFVLAITLEIAVGFCGWLASIRANRHLDRSPGENDPNLGGKDRKSFEDAALSQV
jgi:hypothetical protein